MNHVFQVRGKLRSAYTTASAAAATVTITLTNTTSSIMTVLYSLFLLGFPLKSRNLMDCSEHFFRKSHFLERFGKNSINRDFQWF
jgi:hypothetical protein